MIWALVILILSTGATIQLPETIFSPDKIGHLIAYCLLCGLILWANKEEQVASQKATLWTAIGVSLYGIMLEYVQWAFFPDRFFEVWDMIANITGAAIAVFVDMKRQHWQKIVKTLKSKFFNNEY